MTITMQLNEQFCLILSLDRLVIPYLLWRNSIRGDPYAHPHHIKMLKHFVYMIIWMWNALHRVFEF
jgi:hypothetical protein